MRRASNVLDNRDELRLPLHGLGGSLVEPAAIAQLCFGIGRLLLWRLRDCCPFTSSGQRVALANGIRVGPKVNAVAGSQGHNKDPPRCRAARPSHSQ
jgi:hypothetical protein